MRKDYLEKKAARLTEKRDALKKKGLESTDAAEVRAITEQVNEMNEEIEDIRAEIAEIEAEEQRGATPPANAQTQNGRVEIRNSCPVSATE